MHHAAARHRHGALQFKTQKVAVKREGIVNVAHHDAEIDGVFGYLCLGHNRHNSADGDDAVELARRGKIEAMMSTRRFVATVVGMTVIIALLVILVLFQHGFVHDVHVLPQSDGRSWIEWFDWYSIRKARQLVDDKSFFEKTVIIGLRGVIISICLPLLAWASWRRRSWSPIAGFVLVMLFETGLVGSMKLAMGRELPWISWPQMGRLETGELAFPSGHTTNVVALWGYVAWYFTKIGTAKRKVAWGLVAAASVIVSISSWLIRTHWPTDLFAGTAFGVLALVTVIALYNAMGLNPSATAPRSPTARL